MAHQSLLAEGDFLTNYEVWLPRRCHRLRSFFFPSKRHRTGLLCKFLESYLDLSRRHSIHHEKFSINEILLPAPSLPPPLPLCRPRTLVGAREIAWSPDVGISVLVYGFMPKPWLDSRVSPWGYRPVSFAAARKPHSFCVWLCTISSRWRSPSPYANCFDNFLVDIYCAH